MEEAILTACEKTYNYITADELFKTAIKTCKIIERLDTFDEKMGTRSVTPNEIMSIGLEPAPVLAPSERVTDKVLRRRLGLVKPSMGNIMAAGMVNFAAVSLSIAGNMYVASTAGPLLSYTCGILGFPVDPNIASVATEAVLAFLPIVGYGISDVAIKTVSYFVDSYNKYAKGGTYRDSWGKIPRPSPKLVKVGTFLANVGSFVYKSGYFSSPTISEDEALKTLKSNAVNYIIDPKNGNTLKNIAVFKGDIPVGFPTTAWNATRTYETSKAIFNPGFGPNSFGDLPISQWNATQVYQISKAVFTDPVFIPDTSVWQGVNLDSKDTVEILQSADLTSRMLSYLTSKGSAFTGTLLTSGIGFVKILQKFNDFRNVIRT